MNGKKNDINMNKADYYYINNLNKILSEGSWDKNPRPKYSDGTPAYSKFITQVFEEYDISKNEFPITTLRNTAIKTGIKEIFWIYQKQTSSLDIAHEMNINWWDNWNIGDNTIGQRYGATVNKWDLMNELLNGLVNDPFGRRHIINLYQYSDLKESQGLHPCAYETIFSVRNGDNELILDMTLIQRSSDYLVANIINKIQYLALQMMVAGHCGYKVGKFCHFVQNMHIYDRHFDAVEELLSKTPLLIQPKLILTENKNFYEYTLNDFNIINTENILKIKSTLELAI
jgi:thymidylate synthase